MSLGSQAAPQRAGCARVQPGKSRGLANTGMDPAKMQRARFKNGNERVVKRQTVEVRLDQYEKKATEAGLDPTQLKDGVEQTKKNLKYDERVDEAGASRGQREFGEAWPCWGTRKAFARRPPPASCISGSTSRAA